MPKTFSAITLGGPYDGRMLENMAPHYNVGVDHDPRSLYIDGQGVSVKETMEVFTYVFYEYCGNTFWIPQPVMEKRMFDYHIYNHPMEFVIKRLIDGYNPIARR